VVEVIEHGEGTEVGRMGVIAMPDTPNTDSPPSRLPLSALLSQVLIAFTSEFDLELRVNARIIRSDESPPSLAEWSNVLRLLDDRGVDERRLPALSGISKPVTHILVACLERHGWVTVEPDPADKRAKIVRKTARARRLDKSWRPSLDDVEKQWAERFGTDEIERLRKLLEAIASRLGRELPHYPMALPHRGGTPTGL
jgi:DNA-binding MarR family transcriptional regulator